MEKMHIHQPDEGSPYHALLTDEIERLKRACSMMNDEVSQTLGRALRYPRFCDDQKNFPGSTDADGVCVGDHVAESLAAEAAKEIERLRADAERYRWLRERAPFWAWQPDSNCYPGITVGFSHSETKYCDYTLDAAIDAAMKEGK